MKAEEERARRALIALHDLGSREGATSASVIKAMKKEGFTEKEISAAADEYFGKGA